MDTKKVEEVLAGNNFFSGMAAEHLATLAGCATEAGYKTGDYIFKEGQPSSHFRLILEGEVALEIFVPGSGPDIIHTLKAGSVLGWSWLIPPYKKQYDARAVRPVRALVFDGKKLRDICEKDPRFGYELLRRFAKTMSDRLWAERMRLMDVYGKKG